MKRRKGFTLIELLAVIVILAIIAVIATPIIVGIIEDSRKAAFERSVEGIIHATDIDFGTQEVLSSDPYTISNGVLNKTLKTPIKNIDGFNGKIVYDENGNSTYAIYNEKWCMKKTSEGITTEEYNAETCKLEESSGGGALATITNLVPNENDVVVSGNGQLINLGEYGIRYQGEDPNNYVEFNNETWRIIGIVDGKIKLIRNESIGGMVWNDQDGDGAYDSGIDINNWSEATLQTYLNGDYYNSLIDKDMIDTSTWHIRGYNTTKGIDKYEMYGIERGTGSISGVVMYDIPSIERNMGIMYPSDYGFAAQVTDTCTDDKDLLNYEPCKDTNWLAVLNEWLITPYSVYESYAFLAVSRGFVSDSYPVLDFFGVRPVLYLKSNVKITGDGDGSVGNKYQLTME